ncbi:hypothetical protein GH810_05810 [Acetobacterium paludosum]|uniref:Uncharacterized protein n=1 Tax=Acetobacterium paludosum TaxID=52693 RepID=A0A923HT28_9FIRM|nr:hypothetical protein [Acetobacterium paludosum]MBC3887821.1 hypothetical protein [Acetobacterium paludosum]
MNTNREIPQHSKASRKTVVLYLALIGVILIALILTGIILFQRLNTPLQFVPPGFDPSAQVGEPTPDIDLGYTTVNVEQGFEIKLCGRLFVKNNSVDINLTNPASNDVWMMTELQDKNGKVLGKSGIIKPGEYVQSIALLKNVKAEETNVKIVVIGYAPDTYASRGTVDMNTMLLKQ